MIIDPGYATLPRLLQYTSADQVDAVFVSHSHPDHCADLSPLLRARALETDSPPLAVFAPPGALDAVLSLDRRGLLDHAYALNEIVSGEQFDLGPFAVSTRLLPHFVPNLGVRLVAGGTTFAYTGDTGPSPDI
jgi:ribonuclease BN (tRNA processing enzyme)